MLSVTDGTYTGGPVGLATQKSSGSSQTTAYFDNLIVNSVGGATPPPTVFPQDCQQGGSPSSDGGSSGGSDGGVDSSVWASDASVIEPDAALASGADASEIGARFDGGGQDEGGQAPARGQSSGCSCSVPPREEGGRSALAWLGAVALVSGARARARMRRTTRSRGSRC